MSSRCRNSLARRLSVVLAAVAIAACQREDRHFTAPRGADQAPPSNSMSPLVGGRVSTEFREQQLHEYQQNAWHLSQGKQLYEQFNCVGCHAHGGGDIGPPLMDDEWIYGAQIDQVYLTIAEGRPNGMPAFAGKLSSQQLWQLSAYVRSMSGHGPKAARPGRNDDIHVPSEQSR